MADPRVAMEFKKNVLYILSDISHLPPEQREPLMHWNERLEFKTERGLSGGEMMALELERLRRWTLSLLEMRIREMERLGEFAEPLRAYREYLRSRELIEKDKYLAMYEAAYNERVRDLRDRHHDD